MRARRIGACVRVHCACGGGAATERAESGRRASARVATFCLMVCTGVGILVGRPRDGRCATGWRPRQRERSAMLD